MAELTCLGKLYSDSSLKLVIKTNTPQWANYDSEKQINLTEYFNKFGIEPFPAYNQYSDKRYGYFLSGTVFNHIGGNAPNVIVYLMAKNTGQILRTTKSDGSGVFFFHNLPERPYSQTENDFYMVICSCPKDIPCNSIIYDKILAIPYQMSLIDPDSSFNAVFHDVSEPPYYSSYWSIEGSCKILGGISPMYSYMGDVTCNASVSYLYPTITEANEIVFNNSAILYNGGNMSLSFNLRLVTNNSFGQPQFECSHIFNIDGTS